MIFSIRVTVRVVNSVVLDSEIDRDPQSSRTRKGRAIHVRADKSGAVLISRSDKFVMIKLSTRVLARLTCKSRGHRDRDGSRSSPDIMIRVL
jgi:hypothetical protein